MTGIPHWLDVPFEDDPQPGYLPTEPRQVAAGVVVMATLAETPLGAWPAVLFRFADGDGRFLPDVLLLLDDEKAAQLPALVTSAVASAVREARRRGGGVR